MVHVGSKLPHKALDDAGVDELDPTSAGGPMHRQWGQVLLPFLPSLALHLAGALFERLSVLALLSCAEKVNQQIDRGVEE